MIPTTCNEQAPIPPHHITVDPWVAQRGCSWGSSAPQPLSFTPRAQGWQIMWQHAPVDSGLHEIAQPVEDLAQIMLALAHLFGQQRERGRDKGPFLGASIRGVAYG
jgi:hypothetical protein